MNKHAIVILYSGADRDPGYDVIESIASVITQAGLAVPELIEIKHSTQILLVKLSLQKLRRSLLQKTLPKVELSKKLVQKLYN
jgi:hypothetical protein